MRDITEQILKANGKLTLMLCCVFSFWSGRRTPAKKSQPSSMTEAMILDSEAAVIANFEFLTQAETEMSDDDDMSDEIGENEETDMKTTKRKAKATLNDGKYRWRSLWTVQRFLLTFSQNLYFHALSPTDDVDAEADEVINELNLLTEGEDSNLSENRKADGGDLFVGE